MKIISYIQIKNLIIIAITTEDDRNSEKCNIKRL